MSQVCPSSSHQLVAAAIAFRRARRKFPKNYGLCGNPEDALKFDKTESVSANEEATDQDDAVFSSRKCTNGRSNRAEAKAIWGDECGESVSIKENLLQKPIICSCCRKRNEAAKANEPTSVFKARDQCSAGDTLDIVPSKEYNEIMRKGDLTKSEQLENCDGKTMKSFITESKHSSRCRTSYSHSRRRSPWETSSKLDSVNLLYGRAHDQVDNVKGSGSSEKRNCNDERNCDAGEKDCKSDHRNSRSKLNFFGSQKDNSSPSIPHNCDFHCTKHSTFDLLRPHRDYCRSQSRHRYYHPHTYCHHCCRDEYHSCASKEKPRLSSDTCICSSNSTNQTCPCKKGHVGSDSSCNHDCFPKDSEKISAVQEQNDEEYDDSIATINHKDSLCILVEKYKASKKCKHKTYSGEADFSDDRTKDECSKSCTSEVSCRVEDSVNMKREKCTDNENCQLGDNRVSIGRSCRHGCGQVFKGEDCNQFKSLRSRLVKTGTCCSAKGTPWRHTF